MEALAILIGGFLLLKSGLLAQFGIGSPAPLAQNTAPPAVMVAPSATVSLASIQSESVATHSAISTGTAIATTALKTVSSVSKAIPIIGAALGAISDALFAASAKRAAAAKDENSAVAQGVPGFDQGVTTVVQAYNAGQITAAQVSQLFTQIMGMYWSLVGPHIQSGRNGCSNGSNCPGSANANSSTSLATTAPSTYCSGSIGAACCVGCASLQLSVDNMNYAVAQVAKSGGSMSATIQAVFPSKYGGTSRPVYTVTFTRPSSAFTL